MNMSPSLRKFALTAHVTSTVGWLGAIVGFLAIAIAALASDDVQFVRGAYLAMQLTGWYVLVPFCVASLATGLIMSLGTSWGLFRHYWIMVKFAITTLAAIILFMYTQTLLRSGAVTHGYNMAQRGFELLISGIGTGTLDIEEPPHSNLAPPGLVSAVYSESISLRSDLVPSYGVAEFFACSGQESADFPSVNFRGPAKSQ